MAMTDEQKIEYIKATLGDSTITSVIANPFLVKAESSIFNRMYPTGKPSTVTEIPAQYEVLQCDLAVRYISRMGAEGEVAHNENGINRTYGSVNDSDLLGEVMQIVRV